jgi:hypothetical protein
MGEEVMSEPTTEVTYMIEGSLLGKPWVSYSPNVGSSEAEAAEIFAAWQASRDAAGFEVQYRLVKRTTTSEVLKSE